LRRAMGKKKHEVMVAMREKFLSGAKQKGVPAAKAEKLFDLMAQFAGYGFNKSHSAAYALVAYHTAYLKTHYSVEFMAALLTSEIGNPDKMTHYLNECRDMGIDILPPDINSSERMFTPSNGQIRFGLTAIKNVGDAAIVSVLEARNKLGRFDNLYQFCEHVDLRLLNKRVIESLIKAGAVDSMGARRAQLLAVLDRAMEWGQRRQRIVESGQHGLFGGGDDSASSAPAELPDVPEHSEAERLAGEKELLGFYVTGHPLEKYAAQLRELTSSNSSSIDELQNDAPITLGGVLTNLRIRPSKKGKLWGAATLEDLRGTVDLLVFPQTLEKIQSVLKPDAALLIKGKVRHDENARGKVVVSEAQPLDVAVNGSKPPLHIRINPAEVSDRLLGELEALLRSHPGRNPVLFELEKPDDFRVLMKPQDPKVVDATDQLLAGLRGLLGEDAVTVERRNGAAGRT
ncbi:MAG TPA: OB-fold nucleic acid binding domain-containing protein, partial [Terriglobia bacterium]|nr:OB-fold nucleic acid binding domain-containing protein [Terriglobia bacterium]